MNRRKIGREDVNWFELAEGKVQWWQRWWSFRFGTHSNRGCGDGL